MPKIVRALRGDQKVDHCGTFSGFVRFKRCSQARNGRWQVLAVSRTEVQNNAMPSLDRDLITLALVLSLPCLAILRRRGQRNRCEFIRFRLAGAVRLHRSRRMRSAITIRKKANSSDVASVLTGARCGSTAAIVGCFTEPPAFRVDGRSASCSSALGYEEIDTDGASAVRSDRSPVWIPAQSTTCLLLGGRQNVSSRNRKIGAMSAGSHSFHVQQPMIRRIHSSAPANSVLAPIVDPTGAIARIFMPLGREGAAGRASDHHWRWSEAIE
jgi:hypothetical protein